MTATQLSKCQVARITGDAATRYAAAEVDADGTLLTFEELVLDEATRGVVPNRAARRARHYGRGMNVKQAAKHEAYVGRAQRRQMKRVQAAALEAEAELAPHFEQIMRPEPAAAPPVDKRRRRLGLGKRRQPKRLGGATEIGSAA